jgi:PAS domain S-box-containing protein
MPVRRTSASSGSAPATDQSLTPDVVRKLMERFTLVARAMNDAVWDWDLVTKTVWWNEGFEILFGYPLAAIEPGPESRYSRLHPDDHARVVAGIHAVIDGGGATWSDEYRFRNADGSYADILDRGSVIRDDAGRAVRMVGAMTDLTQRKRAELAQRAIYRIAQAANAVTGLEDLLRQTHEIVAELFPARNCYVALHDPVTNQVTFPYWSDERKPLSTPRTYGRGLTEYILRTGEPLLVTPDVNRDLQARGEIVVSGVPAVDWIGVPLKVQDRTIGVLVVQTYSEGTRYGERERDILQFVSTQVAMAIERQRVESQLRESENRYRLLFEANPEAMLVYDTESLCILAVNEAAIRRYGYSREEFLAMTIKDLRPASEQTRLEQILREPLDGPHIHTNLRHQRKNGTIIDVEVSSDQITFDGRAARLVLATDVTERKQLENQFRQAQKMEAVGKLAGGIAHDFNNLLTAIIGYSVMLGQSLGADDRRRKDIDEIHGAAMRAAGLTQQLLAFSRKQVLQPRVLDLNETVGKANNLLQRLIGENIALTTVLDPGLDAVTADPVQLEQVIINLAVNARDAMPNGGELRIETANAELDAAYTAEHSIVSPGSYVRLTVSDTGVGMDDATKARLFEPFFTTKGPGLGTGLGLSTVYGIVKQSGGFIWVYSELGKGTAFKIYLPRVDAALEAISPAALSPDTNRGTETVLLVEDEPALRAVARRALEGHGYTVIEAADGHTALALAAEHAGQFSAVVTDVVMPAMSGRELAEHLAVSQPDVPFLFMSGYTDDAIVRHGVLEPGVAFLQKPFSPEALARKVRELLHARR